MIYNVKKSLLKYVQECVDPVFRLIRFPLDGEFDFFIQKIDYLKNNLESPFIFVLFLKGKQNKKEKP